MTHEALKEMDELLSGSKTTTPENMEHLVHDMLQLFSELRAKLQSQDEAERKEAVQLSLDLKVRLEEQARALCQSIGIDPAALESHMSNPSHFSTEEWSSMQKAQQEIEAYKKEISVS